MRIKINLQIFIFIVIFILTHQIAIYSWLMMFAFIHEMGHIAAGIILGLKPKSLHIMPFGLTVMFEDYRGKGRCSKDKEMSPEMKKIFIALARTSC